MNLLYLCHANRRPVGGIKVIYKLAELSDTLVGPGSEAFVLHPNHPGFRCTWFDANVKFRKTWFGLQWAGKPSLSKITDQFDPAHDFVVIPELWVRKYGVQLARLGVPYAIFVQNGYLVGNGKREDLELAYRNAKVILSVSEDTSNCIAMAFPHAREKIQRIHLFVDAARFKPAVHKENLITYMPRKLAEHSAAFRFFLQGKLPPDWRLQAIDGLDEAGVAELLGRSKVFVSFSYMEGLGLPPIEAALAGNQVIGYTGEAGKEFWDPVLFTEVHQGDIAGLTQGVLKLVAHCDSIDEQAADAARLRLARTFSAQAQQRDLQAFLQTIGALGR
ncbi:hypothetical protein [Lacisediminimonas sp.]|uniref:hypothetical protein n=1 Tax=Lacisediminimonas sp. TaxID=3060582 RepID=UPI002728703A|nr:hypothetical protein [Lacisediminimonas sp.]MDO8300036.1 hypothetical protein [Lacisediminimonas sp.]MDO9215711.1 hypothetical protein [Lacisediminimonas sp.]